MDEPFSAVDPVVRDELQAEMLRLQSELHKTDRLRHPRYRRGHQARRQGRGVRTGRRAAAVRRAGAAVVQPGQRLRRRIHRRRPRLPRAAVLPRNGPSAARHPAGRRGRDRRSHARPEDWVLVTKPDGSPYAWINADGVALHRDGKFVVRQHHCRRLAVSSGRHAASGAGRGAVVTVRLGRGRRRATGRCSAACMADDVLAALKSQRQARRGRSEVTRGWPRIVRYLLTHLDDAWELTLIHLRLSLIPMRARAADRGSAGRAGAAHHDAAPAHHRHGQHHLHHSVAGAVRGAAADHPDPNPRRGQRHRRADAVHRRAAGARGARGAGRGARPRCATPPPPSATSRSPGC